MSTVDEGRLEGYLVPPGCRDELIDANGTPLPHAAQLLAALRRLGPERLQAAGRRRDTIFMQQGITFEVPAGDGERRDRAWPLDLVPRVLTAAEWTAIKRGLAQRIRALNAFVDDVYHAHEIVRAGVVPWSLVVSRPQFARPVHGVRPPGGVYCHVSGCDLVRGGDGHWRVLEDNVRTPSGISYVIENRLAMTRLMPELFEGQRIRAVDNYPSLLLVTVPADPSGDGHESEAIALLQSVGGAQAYRRAVRDAPTVVPVVRFLLYDSAYRGSVASSVAALRDALSDADAQPRSSPPVLRLERLIAELELQRRTPGAGEALHAILARACVRTSSTWAFACSATTASPHAICRATCSRPGAAMARSRSRSTRTRGSRRCCRSPAGGSLCGPAPTPPIAASPARTT